MTMKTLLILILNFSILKYITYQIIMSCSKAISYGLLLLELFQLFLFIDAFVGPCFKCLYYLGFCGAKTNG